MDFVSGLPLAPTKKDSIWRLAKLYIFKIVRLHGVPVSIILDRDPNFSHDFGRNYMELWALGWISTHHFICRLMDSLKGICYGVVLLIFMSFCLWLSSHIIIVFNPVFRWHPTKHCMVVSVVHYFIKLSCVKGKLWVHIWLSRLRRRLGYHLWYGVLGFSQGIFVEEGYKGHLHINWSCLLSYFASMMSCLYVETVLVWPFLTVPDEEIEMRPICLLWKNMYKS
ncbi:integrase [Gossypium australe]|uniref:Integrase n=1 Tax=Gossypium australe TaxID=47621 RepID=A0A5B6X1B9_9ROSI|nr:integrase [Gossypium australe]